MTAEEAKAHQDDLERKGFNLAWWYGTGCKKCCGVYPEFKTGGIQNLGCWYECEVCGRKTAPQSMPWIAEKEWNAGNTNEPQLSLF